MTPQEFKDEMKRLIDFFGANKYPETIVHAFWNELKGLDEDIFGTQVDSFIQASTKLVRPKAPALEDFKIALFSQLNDVRRIAKDELKKSLPTARIAEAWALFLFILEAIHIKRHTHSGVIAH